MWPPQLLQPETRWKTHVYCQALLPVTQWIWGWKSAFKRINTFVGKCTALVRGSASAQIGALVESLAPAGKMWVNWIKNALLSIKTTIKTPLSKAFHTRLRQWSCSVAGSKWLEVCLVCEEVSSLQMLIFLSKWSHEFTWQVNISSRVTTFHGLCNIM